MEIFNYFLAILIFGGILYLDVLSDYQRWKENKSLPHFKQWVQRILLLSPSILLLSIPNLDITTLTISSLLEGSTWLLLFDGFYNKIRGFDWWFMGSIDKDESWWDKIQRKIPLKLLKVLKIGVPILLLIIFIING